MNGTIKNLHLDKGFGFIKGEDSKEYFFHRSALLNAELDDLGPGQAVTFKVGQGPKGLRAEDVTA